jgi:hypothetical protein
MQLESGQELQLFVDVSGTPYYWINVKLPSGSGYEIVSHEDVPEEDDPENEIHVDVNIQALNDGTDTIQILLGELPIDPSSGEIHIHLLDAQMAAAGGGVITTEEATEASKPIPVL